MHLGQITKLLDYSARHDTIRILRAWPLKPARNPSTQKHFSFHLNLRLCTLPKRLFYSLSLHMILFFPGFLSVQTVFVSTQGPSINYVVSKLEISDPLPPIVVFFKVGSVLVNCLWGYVPPSPPLPRRHSLWTAPYLLSKCMFLHRQYYILKYQICQQPIELKN